MPDLHPNALASASGEELDLFELAKLCPRRTGLPMTVWISPKGGARHDVRIRVCKSHGNRMDIDDTAVVTVRPQPCDLYGELPQADFAVVEKWIVLNDDLWVECWNGTLETGDFVEQARKI